MGGGCNTPLVTVMLGDDHKPGGSDIPPDPYSFGYVAVERD